MIRLPISRLSALCLFCAFLTPAGAQPHLALSGSTCRTASSGIPVDPPLRSGFDPAASDSLLEATCCVAVPSDSLPSASFFVPQASGSVPASSDSSRVSFFEYVTKIPKRNKVFNLDLEMHAGFYADWTGGRLDEAAFRFKDVKIDVSGEVTDRLFYWYRQRINGGYGDLSLENLSESIEYAYIGYKLSDRFTLTAGKQDVFYGGFEYDSNPLIIYEYSDMNEYALCYLTGIGLAYQVLPSQEIRMQITNSRMGSMEETYGRLPDGWEKPKVPLFYTLNWNSSYLDEQINLRYSVSAAEQAHKKYMYSFFAGQNLDAAPWYAYLDVMYTRGALDPLGLLTEWTGSLSETEQDIPVSVPNCAYLSVVAELQYRFHPKWKAFAKGMYDTASLYKASGPYEKGKQRTAWGYQAGIEFYPMADDNLHLFLMGSGRSYSLTEKAKAPGVWMENTGRLSVGFVYKLPLF